MHQVSIFFMPTQIKVFIRQNMGVSHSVACWFPERFDIEEFDDEGTKGAR